MNTYKYPLLLLFLILLGWTPACTPKQQESQVSPSPESVETFHAEMIKASDEIWEMIKCPEAITTSNRNELEVGLGCLEQIIDCTNYSTRLTETWIKWRHRVQMYGGSRHSQPPNGALNERREAMAQVIRLHLMAYPGDLAARKQLELLLCH